jgi:hypothetical protein
MSKKKANVEIIKLEVALILNYYNSKLNKHKDLRLNRKCATTIVSIIVSIVLNIFIGEYTTIYKVLYSFFFATRKCNHSNEYVLRTR